MKKIMFNDRYGLTEAVLEGRKTMTRRVFRAPIMDLNDINRALRDSENATANKLAIIKKYAQYQIGEVLAVAQRYDKLRWPALPGIDWKTITDEVTHSKGWSNKMYVKAEYMPHRIRITDIKMERLQDISDDDCLREGVERWMDCYIVAGIMERGGKSNKCFDTPRDAFFNLITKICGYKTWNDNPWVFAYEFELVQ